MNEGNYGSLKYLAPAIGWGIFILLISALSGRSLSALNFTNLMSIDKWGHFAAYALLSYLVLWGLYRVNKQQPISRMSLIGGVVVCIGYGALLEILQYTVFTDRYFEVFDIIANIIGSVAGAVGYKIVQN